MFAAAPARLRANLAAERSDEFLTTEVFARLVRYHVEARGYRPFLIAFVDRPLRSARLANLFGSHAAPDGVAVATS
jgi:hypothetical protein